MDSYPGSDLLDIIPSVNEELLSRPRAVFPRQATPGDLRSEREGDLPKATVTQRINEGCSSINPEPLGRALCCP